MSDKEHVRSCHLELQDPKSEVPTMYKAYVKGYGYGREYPHNTYLGYLGVLQYFTNLNLGAIKGDDSP